MYWYIFFTFSDVVPVRLSAVTSALISGVTTETGVKRLLYIQLPKVVQFVISPCLPSKVNFSKEN